MSPARRPGGRRGVAMSPAAPPSDASRRVSILRSLRVQHGDQWRAAARKQAAVASRAADDFEAAGDPGMAQMLRRHAEHLAHAAALPAALKPAKPAPSPEAAPEPAPSPEPAP